MIDFGHFYQRIALTDLAPWLEVLPAQLAQWAKENHTPDEKIWAKTLARLPQLKPDSLDLVDSVTAQLSTPLADGEKTALTVALRQFMPWRKGPFHLYDIHIDTEWRSDWKWDRVLPHISPLKDRTILDVGCGSGYHLWRMLGQGAKLAVGIDPTLLFLYQFEVVKKLLGSSQNAHLIPVGIEQLPELAAFDTVFSMGVFYHRRSPLDHLVQLKNQLARGGELVLETLVIEGDEHQVLVPEDRYAKMKNVYFIPSTKALMRWLTRCGFVDVRVVDVCQTTLEEQRRTDWMTNESLSDFLDPNDRTKTIEGYPAPLRAVIVAKKP